MRGPCAPLILAIQLAAAVAVAAAAGVEYEPTLASFRAWQRKHAGVAPMLPDGNYVRGSEEEALAFQTWKINLARVNEHNDRASRGLETYTVSMNRFAGLSNDEYRKLVLRPRAGSSARDQR